LLQLSAPETYHGDTSVLGGTLQLGAGNIIPDGAGFGNLIVDGAGSTFDLNGNAESINALNSTGNLGTVTDTGVNATLTLGVNGVNGSSPKPEVARNRWEALEITMVQRQLTLERCVCSATPV
jgi:autotransporter-associated beta strand protein